MHLTPEEAREAIEVKEYSEANYKYPSAGPISGKRFALQASDNRGGIRVVAVFEHQRDAEMMMKLVRSFGTLFDLTGDIISDRS